MILFFIHNGSTESTGKFMQYGKLGFSNNISKCYNQRCVVYDHHNEAPIDGLRPRYISYFFARLR